MRRGPCGISVLDTDHRLTGRDTALGINHHFHNDRIAAGDDLGGFLPAFGDAIDVDGSDVRKSWHRFIAQKRTIQQIACVWLIFVKRQHAAAHDQHGPDEGLHETVGGNHAIEIPWSGHLFGLAHHGADEHVRGGILLLFSGHLRGGDQATTKLRHRLLHFQRHLLMRRPLGQRSVNVPDKNDGQNNGIDQQQQGTDRFIEIQFPIQQHPAGQ